jgi:hypothetical protein
LASDRSTVRSSPAAFLFGFFIVAPRSTVQERAECHGSTQRIWRGRYVIEMQPGERDALSSSAPARRSANDLA